MFLSNRHRFTLLAIALILLNACVAPKMVKTEQQANRQVSPDRFQGSLQSYWLDQPEIKRWRQPENDNQRLFNWMSNELAIYKGDVKGLQELSRIAIELNQAQAYKRVADLAFSTNEEAIAYDMVSRWLMLQPDNLQAHRWALNLEMVKLQPGADYSKVLYHIDWLLEDSSVPEAQRFTNLATQLAQFKQKDAVSEIMQRVVEKHQDNASAHMAQANLALILKEELIAWKALDRALALTPDYTSAIILQSQMRYRKGDVKAAIQQLDLALKKDKQNRTLRNAYARMLLNNKQYKKATYQYEYLLEDRPGDESLLFTLGVLSIDAEDYKKAQRYFDRLQATSTRQNEASFYLGRIAELKKDYQAAISYYLSVYGGNYFAESRFRAAWAYASLDKFESAYELLINMRQQDDKAIRHRSYLAQGQLLREQKRYQEAMAIYTEALEQQPNNEELLYARSLAAERLDRFDILEQDLKTILQNDPDNIDALNALGYAMLNMTRRYDEAYDLIKRALQLAPESGAIIDSYGWALYRKGQLQESLVYLRKAYELIPDPEIAAHLGEVLWLLGNKQEAEQIWNAALKDAPDSEIVLNTINRLKNQ